MLKISAGVNESTARLGHLGAVHGQEAMHIHGSGRAVTGTGQHRRPEQGMEVDDVLANEVIDLGSAVTGPVVVELIIRAAAKILQAGHVANGGVQPDIKIFARGIGNFEAKVGGIAGDVPFLQFFIQPFAQFVGHLILQGAAARPLLQHVAEFRQAEKEVLGFLLNGCCAGDDRARLDQFRRAIGGTTGLAIITILARCFAFRAGAGDVAVGQEQLFFRIEQLLDRTPGNMAITVQCLVDAAGEGAIFFRMGGVVIVEVNMKINKVLLMLLLYLINQLLRGNATLLGAEHDGGAVGVVSTDV